MSYIPFIWACYTKPPQLYGPLTNLGYIYRSVNQSLVDTEKLLKLLNEPKEVEDQPDAPDLVIEDGEIEFGQLPSLLLRDMAVLILLNQIMFPSLTITEPPR
jgi:ABC-type transport system involved in Fe-S cluster assembly fused permease/ATPase subunit